VNANTSPNPAHPEPPSVLILTRNEERNIAPCLERLAFSDDIVVLDSCSTDRTREIAAAFPNVRVIERPFDTEYKQRNFGLHEISYKHKWVYICDADERVPPQLRDEVLRVVNDGDSPNVAYRVRYKNMFFGRWIKRSSSYPVWLIRLVRPEKVRYEVRHTNVHPIVDGSLGQLREHFEHYSFAAGLRRWFEKHNYYSGREALEAMRVRRADLPRLRNLLSPDPLVRRRTFKNLSFFMPCRGGMRFLFDAILRMGFLDGLPGLRYTTMISMYEHWIELKMMEQVQSWEQRTDAKAHSMVAQGETASDNKAAQHPVDAQGRPLVEVLIPTLNEASHIKEAVENARLLGPVFVLDSLSTDGTQEIARSAGATVVEHRFVNYSAQKNWGIDNLPFKGDWVFILDADERITPALRREVIQAVTQPEPAAGYYINRVFVFMGRALKHGGLFPSWNLRLFRRGRCRYEDREVHEHMVANGPTEYLKELMIHIRRESMSDFLAKHIRYADMESDAWVRDLLGRGQEAVDHLDSSMRYRQYLRRVVWPRWPFKPLVRFVYMYLFRLGFLDGRAGWHMALLMCHYEYMIELLYKEKLQRLRESQGQGVTLASAPSAKT
jgi:glycosyltransferase involved in cell wall biosynthesis